MKVTIILSIVIILQHKSKIKDNEFSSKCLFTCQCWLLYLTILKMKQYQHKISFHKKNCILNILIVRFLCHKSARKKGTLLALKIHKPFGLITRLAHWGPLWMNHSMGRKNRFFPCKWGEKKSSIPLFYKNDQRILPVLEENITPQRVRRLYRLIS